MQIYMNKKIHVKYFIIIHMYTGEAWKFKRFTTFLSICLFPASLLKNRFVYENLCTCSKLTVNQHENNQVSKSTPVNFLLNWKQRRVSPNGPQFSNFHCHIRICCTCKKKYIFYLIFQCSWVFLNPLTFLKMMTWKNSKTYV